MAPTIQHIEFNSAQDCFAVGTDAGVRVFSSDPLVEVRNLNVTTVGSVKLCAMLHRTNLLAIVGGGSHPKFADNSVLIWDDVARKFVLELTLPGPILNVLLAYSKLIVVLARQIHVFSFPNPCVRISTQETRENFHGLCQLSSDPNSELLVYPGFKIGSVQLVDMRNLTKGSSIAPATVNAHQSEVTRIALNNQGTLLATGSTKGTVVRVFDTRTRQLMSEFRRGSDPANLQCLRFSPCSSFLCVSSDKGTVHIFAVRDKQSNRKTLLQQVGIVTDEAQRSLAQFSLPDIETACTCAFVGTGKQSVVALCYDGTYHRFQFSLDGSCNRDGFDHFLDLGDEQEFWTVAE
uniref:WD repeat domain phosphoinositide-interacting protein 4 n=1 Tax=Plectus sambesii TaxID=2011161 RepID=A0A914VHW6_9BILA